MPLSEISMHIYDIKKFPDRSWTGYYLRTHTRPGKYGTYRVHEFLAEGSGERIRMYGFTSMDLKMDLVSAGTFCNVRYTGMSHVKTKYGPADVHQVIVLQDPERRIEAAQFAVSDDECVVPLPSDALSSKERPNSPDNKVEEGDVSF
jgi:hypothetical protein